MHRFSLNGNERAKLSFASAKRQRANGRWKKEIVLPLHISIFRLLVILLKSTGRASRGNYAVGIGFELALRNSLRFSFHFPFSSVFFFLLSPLPRKYHAARWIVGRLHINAIFVAF